MIDRLEARLVARLASDAPRVLSAALASPRTASIAQPDPAAFSGDEGSESGEEDAAPWPTQSEEAAYLAQGGPEGEASPPVQYASPASSAPSAPPQSARAPAAEPPPPLEPLVQRIPPSVRDLLDELFRAKFIAVRKYPTSQ